MVLTRLLLSHHKSLLVFKLCLAQNFVSFSDKLDYKQKSYLLDIMDKFYLSNIGYVSMKVKRTKKTPEEELKSQILEFSQTNNLEIKMCVVRNMHHFLGPPITSSLREKFAAYYTHIESESKGNWRIRFSILTSLMGRLTRNPEGLREPEHDQPAHLARLYRPMPGLVCFPSQTGLANVRTRHPLLVVLWKLDRVLLLDRKVCGLLTESVCDPLLRERPSLSAKASCT